MRILTVPRRRSRSGGGGEESSGTFSRLPLAPQTGSGPDFWVDERTGPLPLGNPHDLLRRAPLYRHHGLFTVPSHVRGQHRIGGGAKWVVRRQGLLLENIDACA